MKISSGQLIPLVAILAALPASARAADEPVRYAGQVYDLDFSQGRDRIVVMMLNAASNTLVAETSELGVLGVLQTGLMLGVETPRLVLPGPARAGRVQELSFDSDAGRLEARVKLETEEEVVVATKDPRAQAILQTAMREGRPLEDLQFDPESHVLDRVKLRLMR